MHTRIIVRLALSALCAGVLLGQMPARTSATTHGALRASAAQPAPGAPKGRTPAPMREAKPPAITASQTPAASSTATAESPCAWMALTDAWELTVNAAYSAAASEAGLASTHRQSAAMTFALAGAQFGNLPPGEPSRWTAALNPLAGAVAITGTGELDASSEAFGGCAATGEAGPACLQAGRVPSRDLPQASIVRTTERGGGAPVAGEAVLTLNRATCTYDLDARAAITTLVGTSDTTLKLEVEDDVLDLHVRNRPYAGVGARSAFPELIVSGFITVPLRAAGQTEYFAAAQTLAFDRIAALSERQGQADAGLAQVSWTLKPKPITLSISDVRLKEYNVRTWPSPDLVGISGEGGTYDGNWVTLSFNVAQNTASLFQLPGRPRQRRNLRIEVGPADKPLAVADTSLVIRPRPVILVHGLNSNAGGWSVYPDMLRRANPLWLGFPVAGMRTGNGIFPQEESATIAENATVLGDYVRGVRSQLNAWHVDIVAHSMGGLIARKYIDSIMPSAASLAGMPAVRNLVMLGTPNQGSECARIQAELALKYPLVLKNLIAPYELLPEVVFRFNQATAQRNAVNFSVLAGDDLPFVCPLLTDPLRVLNPLENDLDPSDGVVTVDSAIYNNRDFGYTKSDHVHMTGSEADFRAFVLPRLARTPIWDPRHTTADVAALEVAPAPGRPQISQMVAVDLAPGIEVNVPMTLPLASRAGIAVLARNGVMVELRDPTGAAAVAKALGDGMHGFVVAAPAPGIWQLRLRNTTIEATTAFGLVSLAGTPITLDVQVGRPDGQGGVPVTAALVQGGAALRGGEATAAVASAVAKSPLLVMLHDDGAHGDGAPGDGVFGGVIAGRAGDAALVQITARLGAVERTTSVIVGAGPGPGVGGHRALLPVVLR